MEYSISKRNCLWVCIVSLIGTISCIVTDTIVSLEHYLHHPVFHVFTFLTEEFFTVFPYYLPFILFTVYLMFFAKKKINHIFFFISCAVFALSNLWNLFIKINVLFLNSSLNELYAELGQILYVIISLVSVIFSVFAIVSMRKLKFVKILKIFAIIMIALNILLVVCTFPYDVDNIIATTAYFLFWIFCIKKKEDSCPIADIKTEIAKAEYLLEIGMISQEEFEQRKNNILAAR